MAFQNDHIILPPGTRARVDRVRAEYPNQLDYNGSVHSYSPTTHGNRYNTWRCHFSFVLLHDLHLAVAGPASSFVKPAQQNLLKQTFSCKSCFLACDACENNRKHSGRPHRLSKPTRGSGTRTHARKPHRLSRPTSQPPAPTSSPAASTRGDPISLASRRAGAGLEPTRANPTGEVSLDAILFQLQSDVGYAVP